MSAMTASAAAARVAASTRTNGSAKSSRVVKTNAVAQRNGIAQSSAFFQGDRSTAVELRQRAVTSPVSRRHISKRQVAAGASVPAQSEAWRERQAFEAMSRTGVALAH